MQLGPRVILPNEDLENVTDNRTTSGWFRLSLSLSLSLSVEEQIDYLQSLWERIAAQPEHVPVPNWHREVLAERLEAVNKSPDEGKSWDDFDLSLLSSPVSDTHLALVTYTCCNHNPYKNRIHSRAPIARGIQGRCRSCLT